MAPFAQKHIPAHLKPENNPTGRPSEYRPEYCDMVLEFMSQGYSLTAFAGSIRMERTTIYEWIKRHAAFSNAVARARMTRVTALEAKLLRSRKGAETSAAIFALKNADPTEWRDLKHTQHDHNVRVETLSDAQLYAIAGGNSAGDGSVIDAEFERVATS